ncbi:MAG TPA: thymidylate kinase [bacterium]|nr:thymidylate kinase [bacterium]
MKQGKLIVVEGSDGSGKKTQADILLQNLEKAGYETAFYDFPQYYSSFFGAMVGRYLDGEFGGADDVSPYLSSLLYAGDRWQASEKIEKDLADGKIIVTNRYTQSNMAFQVAKMKKKGDKEKLRSWINELEFGVYGIPRPDLILFLYVPVKIGHDLVAKKVGRKYSKKTHDIHEANDDFMLRSEKEYLWLAENEDGWKKIECVKDGKLQSIEVISDLVWATIEPKLSQHLSADSRLHGNGKKEIYAAS